MQEVIKKLLQPNNTKIVFCVLDGVGGLPQNGKTELEAAKTPNLDALAQRSACGQHLPVAYGITPGSGAAHLGLFGYDPLKYEIGRGVLEALGLGIQLTPNDLAIRGNFATVKYEGDTPIVTDRRAGRIPTEENIRIVSKITEKSKEIDGVKVNMTSGMEHRSAIIFTFPEPIREGGDAIHDTDPQLEGISPIPPTGNNPEAQKVADVVGKFINQVAEIIRDEKRAKYILLRESGCSKTLGLVPIRINAKNVRAGGVEGFGEADCLKGELGTFRAVDLMTLVLAHAGRLQKYGA